MESSWGRILVIPKGEYSGTTEYSMLDMVTYQDSSYVAKTTTVGNLPTNTDYWQVYVDTSAKMSKSVYDSDNDGIVDNTEKVNNHTVEADVPSNAEFTDTTSITDFTDIDISNPSAGQELVWDSTNTEWKNGQVQIPSTFATMEDTAFTNLSDEQIPMYNAANQKWENVSIYQESVTIVTWADGTDAEIAAMLEAHYNDVIDIHDYWAVGDERQVSLSAMAATGVGESHVAQTVTMVLMNEGGKTLVTPINNHTECAFIVGQKDSLIEVGYMNPTSTNVEGWDGCARRTWCNSVYKNALPSTLVGIFKEHQNPTAYEVYWGSVHDRISNDYFSLPSEKEIFGKYKYGRDIDSSIKQFQYYSSGDSIRKKKLGSNGEYSIWFSRSPYDMKSSDGLGTMAFCSVSKTGTANRSIAGNNNGIAPFGVI